MNTTIGTYAFLASPFIILLLIGISYTNKVEGITKAIVGMVVFFSIIYGSYKWCISIRKGEAGAEAICGFLPLIFARYYIAAYVLIVIAMFVFRK
jgi:hypothetical protein